jgi:hypothetical protein
MMADGLWRGGDALKQAVRCGRAASRYRWGVDGGGRMRGVQCDPSTLRSWQMAQPAL